MVSASYILLIIAGTVALLAVFAFLSATLTAQRGRTAAYYSVRRETQQKASHRLALSLALLLLAGILFAGAFVLPKGDLLAGSSVNTPLPPTVTATATNIAPTPASQVTATAPSIVSPELESPLNSPLPSPEAASTPAIVAPNLRLALNAIASGIDEHGLPVGADTRFQAGTPTLYIFYNYRDVPPDALLRHTWFRDGGSVYYDSQHLNKNGEGLAVIEWSPRGGFKPGLYEVRFQLGGVPQFVANFEVK